MTRLQLPFIMLLAGLLTLATTAWTGGLSPSLIEPDEGGHYVNALFLGDWLRAGMPSPMPFARGFYAHFPRLSIGHWPPGWYLLEAPFCALLRPTPLQAAYASALIAGMPAVAIAWAMNRIRHPRLAIALALGYVLLPLTLDGARYILVDQPLTLLIAAATIAWAAASTRPDCPRMLLFALLAAACPLVKGNGALIALVPAFDIMLTRRWSLLRRPPLWGAALLALAIVSPWYWLSFRISAEGFNYSPGLQYAWLALETNLATLRDNVGWAGIALAMIGMTAPDEPRIARLALAVILATLTFQSAVPAALAARYCAPLLPWAVVLAGFGIVRLARFGWWGGSAAGLLGLAVLLPNVASITALTPKPDIGAPALAARMATHGGLYLVDGRSGAEGAIIAAAAHADDGRRRIWVARATQWLSTSDFMGRGYRLTAKTPSEARAVLDRLGASGIVSITTDGRPNYPHSHILLHAISTSQYATITRPFRAGRGSTIEAYRRTAVPVNAGLLASDPVSTKAGQMSRLLD